MATLGYAQTSTRDQEAGLQAQIRDLIAAGCFTRWAQSLTSKVEREVVAIDGRTVRRSGSRRHDPPRTARILINY